MMEPRRLTSAELDAIAFTRTKPIPDIPAPNKPETPHDAPVKMYSGETVSVERAFQILQELGGRPDPIRHRWGDWIITDYGVECVSHPYWIE